MESNEGDRPLFAIAKSWKGLQGELGEGQAALRLGSFSQACSLISPLFGCLGIAFKFAEKDYVAKVSDPPLPLLFSHLLACFPPSFSLVSFVGS